MKKEEIQPSVGYDQVANVIHLIKTEPSSRRIIIDLWDCSTVHKAALPSCLCKYQFNVNVTKKELNLAIYFLFTPVCLTCCPDTSFNILTVASNDLFLTLKITKPCSERIVLMPL